MTSISPASCVVECSGARHHLVWRDGVLNAFDHPDAERERALTALGGDAYPCLQLLQVWEQHTDDLDVLLLGPRGPNDVPADQPGDPRRMHRPGRGVTLSRAYASGRNSSYARPGRGGGGWISYAPLGRSVPAEDIDLADVLRLGGGLPQRLTAQVVDVWSRRLADGTAEAERPRLHAALYGRFAAVARGWLGDPNRRIDLTMIDDMTDEPAVTRTEAGMQVRLPFTWLSDVWVPGLATIADRLVLAADRPADGQWRLTGVDRGLNATTIRIEVS